MTSAVAAKVTVSEGAPDDTKLDTSKSVRHVEAEVREQSLSELQVTPIYVPPTKTFTYSEYDAKSPTKFSMEIWRAVQYMPVKSKTAEAEHPAVEQLTLSVTRIGANVGTAKQSNAASNFRFAIYKR